MRTSDEMKAVLQGCMDDYEQAFYTVLARSFGLKNNVLPFAMLAVFYPSSSSVGKPLVRKMLKPCSLVNPDFF